MLVRRAVMRRRRGARRGRPRCRSPARVGLLRGLRRRRFLHGSRGIFGKAYLQLAHEQAVPPRAWRVCARVAGPPGAARARFSSPHPPLPLGLPGSGAHKHRNWLITPSIPGPAQQGGILRVLSKRNKDFKTVKVNLNPEERRASGVPAVFWHPCLLVPPRAAA